MRAISRFGNFHWVPAGSRGGRSWFGCPEPGVGSDQKPGARIGAPARKDHGGLTADLAGADRDDTLALLFLCCHPALSPPSQLALTLRAAGGLTTAQIAAAFLVPDATIAKRIVRAKHRIRNAGARFELPAQPQRTERLGVVLQVLYLIFNEGYTTSSGPALHRTDLTAEAIRLTRLLYRLLPDEAEIAGLLAVMLVKTMIPYPWQCADLPGR
jgi:predicted RNA polymerase sigma factor